MSFERTTVTVRPKRAEGLREFRDANDLNSMDAALAELLDERTPEDNV